MDAEPIVIRDIMERDRRKVVRLLDAALAISRRPADEAWPASEGASRRRGFRDLGRVPHFYRALSLATGARCRVCGPPSCRCAARLFPKDLRAAD